MDSPGHNAKHCIYSLMDTINFYVIHIENVDVREAQMKSTVMEKVGCDRSLRAVMEKIKVSEFVTDANGQIIKMLREYDWMCEMSTFKEN